MSNLPTWTQAAATTPRHKRRAANAAAPDKMAVTDEARPTHIIGTVAKVTRTTFQWEAYETAIKEGSKARPKVASKGRCRALLTGISRVRFEYSRTHAP